jgi:hypothetical protein
MFNRCKDAHFRVFGTRHRVPDYQRDPTWFRGVSVLQSVKYSQIPDKPHDCEWDFAPPGNNAGRR